MRKVVTGILLLISITTYSQVMLPGVVASSVQTESAPSTLLDGLIGYWGLNETSGSTAYDATDNNNDLTISGATVNQSGRLGTSFSFDGSNDYVGDIDGFEPTEVSLACWVYTTDAANYKSPCGNYHSSVNGYDLIKNPNGTIEWNIRSNGTTRTYITSSTAINNGAWHHVVGTFDGDSLRLYIDGEEDASPAYHGLNITYYSSNRFSIGDRDATSSPWIGRVDDVVLYNRAISADEVLELFESDGYPFD